MQEPRITAGDEADQDLAEAVDQAMCPALLAAARAAVFAASGDNDLPTTDPEVMVQAIYETAELAGRYWEELADGAGQMLHGNDPSAVDDARLLVARMIEVADVFLDHLSCAIETD